MKQKLLKYDVDTVYRVELPNDFYVNYASSDIRDLRILKIGSREDLYYTTSNLEEAKNIAKAVGGKIVKLTRTNIVVLLEEEVNSD